MIDDQFHFRAVAVGLDPAWRRRSDEESHDDGCRFAEAAAAAVDHTPILLGVHRPLEELLELMGGV